jgi:hypothetical protein
MGSPYAGNPASFPADYVIPDDSDPPTAAAINVGLEALGDRTAYLKSAVAAFGAPAVELTTSGITTWVCPANVFRVRLEMCGGGGGGAGGGCGIAFTLSSGCGGGGGAGAPLVIVEVPVTPGVSYDIGVGNGGHGGAGSTGLGTAANGSQGGSSFFRPTGGDNLAVAFGGTGGKAQDHADLQSDYATDPRYGIAPGGSSVGGNSVNDGFRYTGVYKTEGGGAIVDAATPITFATSPGDGGDGVSKFLSTLGRHNGKASAYGMCAGTGGSGGANDLTGPTCGGGPGGGGGAGPFTTGAHYSTPTNVLGSSTITGGNGGSGGDGHNASNAGAGSSGASAPANTGGGGGGGGAGGCSVTGTPGTGGAGGDGGSGFVRLTVAGVA